MARRARRLSETKIYHIVFRGLNKQDIFRDEKDYERLLERLMMIMPSLLFRITVWDLIWMNWIVKEKNILDYLL